MKKIKEEMNINQDKNILLTNITNLSKHGFMYFNLENGCSYNDKFI